MSGAVAVSMLAARHPTAGVAKGGCVVGGNGAQLWKHPMNLAVWPRQRRLGAVVPRLSMGWRISLG